MKKLHHEKCAIEEDMQKKIGATWMEPKTRNVQCEKSAIRKKVQHEKSATRKKDATWKSAKKVQHETVERKKWRDMKRMRNKKFRMKTLQYEKNKTKK